MHAAVLRYFAAVARAGSIRKASEELHVATSAVSRQIQKLEDELGAPLFERLPKGLRLTRAGSRVLRHAQSTLEEFDLLKSELGALKGVKTGQIRIAALDSLLVRFLPDQISRFHSKHPGVDFKVQSATHSRIATQVAEGDADFGITFNLAHPDDTELVSDVAMPLMAMVASHHPLASKKSVTLAECSSYNLLLQLDTEPIRSLIDVELSVFNRIGRTLVASNNIAMLRPIIQAGLGVAFFTPLGLSDELKSGDIVGVPIDGSRLGGLRMGILIPKRRQPTHAASAMIEQVRTALGGLGAKHGGPSDA